MRDVELYRHLLGLEEPWIVRSVELNVQGQRVDVWAATARMSAGRVPSAGPADRVDHEPPVRFRER